MATYLFYDLETTGLSKAFDQILQFAAVRTDTGFNELERHEIYIKLRPDVVPSPGASIAHCISIEKAMQQGVSEYDAVKEIHGLVNQPETTSLGYNTMGFDDEFLRFAFHRNLLPPYTHQYANDCRRMDLLPMVMMFWLFRNEVLEWPEIDGRVSLKLEKLKEANHLSTGTSHDALVDVEASVELARRLLRDREMWDSVADHFNKRRDRARTEKLPRFSETLRESYRLGLLVGLEVGAERNYLAPALFLGYSEHYNNQCLWLRLDRPELQETTPDNIAESTWVVRKKYGEPGIILPPHDRFMARLDGERTHLLADNKHWLEAHPDLLQEIAAYYCSFKYQEVENVDIDAALYGMEFMSDDELRQAARFHATPVAEKLASVENFDRPELRELAIRLLFRNLAPEVPSEMKSRFDTFVYNVNPVFKAEALIDYRGRPRLLPAESLAEIEELRKSDLQPRQADALRELELYLRQHFKV